MLVCFSKNAHVKHNNNNSIWLSKKIFNKIHILHFHRIYDNFITKYILLYLKMSLNLI